MQEFIAKHQDKIAGTLSGFDRLVFRGHLRSISYPRGVMTHVGVKRITVFMNGGAKQFANRFPRLLILKVSADH